MKILINRYSFKIIWIHPKLVIYLDILNFSCYEENTIILKYELIS